MLVDDEAITGIIDFTSACIMPLVWEIARSFAQSDRSAADGEIQHERMQAYLECYLRAGELNSFDVAHMFDIYYLQLLGSTFGYRQAAEGFLESNRLWNLGEFAMWRTRMCRWLSRNRSALTAELVREFS